MGIGFRCLHYIRSEELSAPELKKLQRKERKAKHKAAQAKAHEEKKGERGTVPVTCGPGNSMALCVCGWLLSVCTSLFLFFREQSSQQRRARED